MLKVKIRDGVVTHSKCCADMIDTLIDHKEDLVENIADAVTADKGETC